MADAFESAPDRAFVIVLGTLAGVGWAPWRRRAPTDRDRGRLGVLEDVPDVWHVGLQPVFVLGGGALLGFVGQVVFGAVPVFVLGQQ